MQAEGLTPVRRTEPWPWILASLLLAMMTIASGFAWIAATHPDPVIVDEHYEARADRFEPRLRDGAATR